MGRHLHLLYLFLCITILTCCVSHQVYIDRAIIRNETNSIISGVRVQHEATGKIGQVHSILPRSSLDLGFSRSPMLAKKSIVTWEGQNGQRIRVELEFPGYQPGNRLGQSLVLVYTIHPDGSVTVDLEE